MSAREESAAFEESLGEGYAFDEPSIEVGRAMRGGKTFPDLVVRVPLSTMNRHGLVAGATGTGKTRTLQTLADRLSLAGVPVFLADLKGDLTGMAKAGAEDPKVLARVRETGTAWTPGGNPVELLSLTGATGVPLRATVSSFGPLLLARVLDLNDTQAGALAIVFRFADREGLPILDLSDLRAVLLHLTGEDAPDLSALGGLAKATAGVLIRKLTQLEEEGAGVFFGEPEFEVRDLLRTTPDGRGVVSILRLTDVQERPRLFSTFLLWLLAELFQELPERGDVEKPGLVFFFDEAHFLFDGASKALRGQIEQVVRLIRSKGVGVYFVTQSPKDLPADVLGQLGSRYQHALRAFTPDDAKALKAAAGTFPTTAYYDVADLLNDLGTGEALVTVLSPKGVPTPVAATKILPPLSFMGPLADPELAEAVRSSTIRGRYADAVDRESALEMLAARLEGGAKESRTGGGGAGGTGGRSVPASPPRPYGASPSPFEDDPPERGKRPAPRGRAQPDLARDILRSPLARMVGQEILRGLFGVRRRR